MSSSGSHQYLYERLGDRRFQQFCGALLVHEFPDVRVFPVGEKDGGRDIVSGTGNQRTILQVKHSGDRSKKSLRWVKDAIEGEDANIRRLVAEGCVRYILITNVEGSATRDSGTRDQVDRYLDDASKAYGVPMECWWSSDLDARVAGAPWEIKAAFLEMLAGSELLLAMLNAKVLEERERREMDILHGYTATNWGRDKHVKFHQVDLASDLIAGLFVDLSAERVRMPDKVSSPLGTIDNVSAHLVRADALPLTIIEGVPGQGKSTVAQFVSQVYRADFIGRDKLLAEGEQPPALRAADQRVAIRIDLADWAEWSQGGDPYAVTDGARKAAPRQRIALERFLVEHLGHGAPGHDIKASDVRDILDRYPTHVVLDGLDEVASADLRTRIVVEIDEFANRWVPKGNMRVLVTTRPNSSGMSEPDATRYERLLLQPLNESTKKRYLRQWATAQRIEGQDRRSLERIFGEQSAAPHIAELASNPMQLTILLHLIRSRGETIPTGRTELFDAYMDLFLQREATKWAVVRDHREDLEEASAYLGWLMQARAEANSSAIRMSSKRIVREIKMFFAGVEKDGSPVQELFEAMRDRVWVLTSKETGSYEFDVQSIREFFAARYLYDIAESDSEQFSAEAALIELLPRSYWANTARFLGGHFKRNDISSLADAIEERVSDHRGIRQVLTTVWALLNDGVFKERPQPQRRVAELFADDLSVVFLAADMGSGGALPDLPVAFGGEHLSRRLRSDIEAAPESPLTQARAKIASRVGDGTEFDTWWASELGKSVASDREADWLAVGRFASRDANLPSTTIEALALSTPAAARSAISAGLSPAAGTAQERLIVAYVLDGHCSDAWTSHGTTEGADLLRVAAPWLMLRLAQSGSPRSLYLSGHNVRESGQAQRTAALKRLAERHGGDALQRALRIQKGTTGTTARWVDAARVLTKVYGRPTWLATEIAAIGAGLPPEKIRTGGGLTKDSPCFGPEMDYGRWLMEIRRNHDREEWWRDELEMCTDHHARATWVLGALVVASPRVLTGLAVIIDGIVKGLPGRETEALVGSSSRIGAASTARRLPSASWGDLTPTTRLLLAHHGKDLAAVESALGKDRAVISNAAQFPSGGWPAAELAQAMLAESPSTSGLDLVGRFGLTRLAIPTSAGAQSTGGVRLTPDLADHVLSSPTCFSIDWLREADRVTADQYEPLKGVADTVWAI